VEGREREGPQVTVEPGPLRAVLYATDNMQMFLSPLDLEAPSIRIS